MKPFTDTLNAMRFGTLSEDLTRALHELTAACVDTQRPGALTLTLQLKPGKGGQIVRHEPQATAQQEQR